LDQVPVERRPTVRGHIKRLRWVGIIIPVVFILSLEAFRLAVVEGGNHSVGHFLLALITLSGVVVFAFAMFRAIEATQRQLIRQNRELTAINAVSTAVQGELGIDVIIDAALESVIDSTGATEATIRIFPSDGTPEGDGGIERRRIAGPHASPQPVVGSLVPHLIDIPLSTGTSVVGRLQLHLPAGVDELDLLATATLNNIGHQLAASIQIGQFVVDLKRRQREGHGLYSVLLQISNQDDLADILAHIVGHARELLGAEDATMCLSEASSRAVQLDAPVAAGPAFLDGTICVSGGPDRFVAPHERAPSCRIRFAADIGATLEAPIRSPDGSLGDIWLGRRGGAAFTGRDRGFLVTLSDLASIAITSARMRESERQGAIVTERERIAREMHDSLAQILGVTHLRIVALGSRAELAAAPAAIAELADLATLTEEAYRDVREAILGLREASRVDRGFVDSIEAYLGKYSHQAGITATLESSIEGELALPPRSELQIIRVIQEALTNVRKHGAATAVVVRISDDQDGTRIVISDDGRGFDVAETLLGHDGYGLHTMRERMELVGGTLTIDSAPGRGTRIIAIMPRPAQAGAPIEVNGAGDDTHPHPVGR
jgi:two-component system nitrate/nitrite sensor histidine kinase NarX